MSEEFRILIVCTGNLCRSPLIERLLRRRLADRLGPDAATFRVSSAGVRGLTEAEMDESAAAELRRLGGDPSGFRSRALAISQVRDADLILTASREHRSGVLRDAPEALRRIFTVREFAHLVPYRAGEGALWPDSLTEAVRDAANRRGSATLDEYDLEDPIGGSTELHRRVADAIEDAVHDIVEGFAELRDRIVSASR